MEDTRPGFTITREISAAPDRIWTAWTEERAFAEWVPGTVADSVSLDIREGGRYIYSMSSGSASDPTIVTGGIYRIVDEPRTLTFTWGEPDADPETAPEISVAIGKIGEGSRLVFTVEGYEGHAGDGFVYDGWAAALDSLERFVTQ